MTFFGNFFFPSKVKHSPVFFWLVCTLFLRNTKTKYWSVHNERNKAEQEHFSQKKIQESVILLNWKARAKIQSLLKEKKFTQKSHSRPSCTKPFNYWMRLSRIWKILQIKEGVINRDQRPKWITPSKICRVVHILRKPNSIIAYW